MEILLQIIEEEVDVALNQLTEQYDDYDSGGGGEGVGPFKRDRFIGAFLSPITDLAVGAVGARASEIGVKAVRTIGELIANTVTSLLPFNDSHLQDKIDEYFPSWEDSALTEVDRAFSGARNVMDQGWETFKSDFWGIGFIASPMNAIAAYAVGEKGLDTAFSVLNTVTAGRAGAALELITGNRGERLHEDAKPKIDFKNLPEDQKKNIFQKLMKNSEVLKAAEEFSKKHLPEVMGKIFKNMNKYIVSGKGGSVTPTEIAEYKAGSPNIVTKMFEQIKNKTKKFKVEPSEEVLTATNNVVSAEIKSMPNVIAQPQEQPVAQQTQQATNQPAAQPQPLAAQPKQ